MRNGQLPPYIEGMGDSRWFNEQWTLGRDGVLHLMKWPDYDVPHCGTTSLTGEWIPAGSYRTCPTCEHLSGRGESCLLEVPDNFHTSWDSWHSNRMAEWIGGFVPVSCDAEAWALVEALGGAAYYED